MDAHPPRAQEAKEHLVTGAVVNPASMGEPAVRMLTPTRVPVSQDTQVSVATLYCSKTLEY